MERRDAKHGEVSPGDSLSEDPFGFALVREVEARVLDPGKLLQRGDTLTDVVEVADRRIALAFFPCRVGEQDTLGVRERKRLQDDGIDDTEDRGRCAQAKSQRQNGGKREAGIHAALPHRKGEILPQFIQPLTSSKVPVPIVAQSTECRLDAGDSTGCLGPRTLSRPAALDQFLQPQLTMMRELFAYFLLDRHAPQHRTETTTDSHLNLPP